MRKFDGEMLRHTLLEPRGVKSEDFTDEYAWEPLCSAHK